MAVLVRSGEARWVEAEQKAFLKERHLQDLLLRSPELVETKDRSRLLLTDEASLSGGTPADLLGVTSSGNILIIETKLASNAEIRRKVIGQILEYASKLWQVDYGNFDNFFRRRTQKSIADTFAETVDEFDEERFRATIEQNLREGRFQLLIAVDDMNPELERILEYIAVCGQGLRLEALAFRLFEQGETQILVPQRYGITPSIMPGNIAATRSTIEEIVEHSPDESTREKMRVIVQLWQHAGFIVVAATAGLSLRVSLPSRVVSMFWATPNDSSGLQPNFQQMQQYGMPEPLLTRLRKAIGSIPGFAPDRMLTMGQPPNKFSQLTLESIQRFVELMISTAAEWRQSFEVSADEKPPLTERV